MDNEIGWKIHYIRYGGEENIFQICLHPCYHIQLISHATKIPLEGRDPMLTFTWKGRSPNIRKVGFLDASGLHNGVLDGSMCIKCLSVLAPYPS